MFDERERERDREMKKLPEVSFLVREVVLKRLKGGVEVGMEGARFSCGGDEDDDGR